MKLLTSLQTNTTSLLQWLRDKNNNFFILNNLLILFAFSLTISHGISSSILWIILLLFLLNPELKQRLLYALKNKIVQAFLLYFSLFVIWSIGSDDMQKALYFIKYNKPLLYSVIFVAIIQKEFINKIIYAFIFGMLINVLWSYLIFFGVASSPWNRGYDYLPLLHKSDHGFFVLILLGYALYRILKDKEKTIITLFFFIIFLLESFNIFITGSRTSMLTYFVMLFVSLLVIYRQQFFKIAIIASLLSIVLLSAVYLFLPSVTKNATNEYNKIVASIIDGDYDSSSGSRIGLVIYSIPVIKENFLFGVGTGDHISAVEQQVLNSENFKDREKYAEILRVFSAGDGASLHNNYVQQLVQFGVFGIFVIFYLVYQIFRFPNYAQESYRFLAFLISILTLVVMIPGYDFGFNNFGKFFVFMISILIAQDFQTKKIQKL